MAVEQALTVSDVIAARGVRSVFQPIVDLSTGAVLGHEALSRGLVGSLWESPAALFAAARTSGVVTELDEACRLAAFRGARDLGILDPLAIFVNVEPEALDQASFEDLLEVADEVGAGLRVVLEITERALSCRPAQLLRTVERVRELGWGIALDDVGVETASLTFMELLQPDVVKLDLSLVQGRPTSETAEIMNAVNAYAERTGAVLLAEGIETEQHLETARALGATLGQGWMLGRPTPAPDVRAPAVALRLPPRPLRSAERSTSPFAALPAGTVLRRSQKRLLIELSKHLEREAMRIGGTCVVASTFQYARHFTPATVQRYRDLVERTGFVCVLGEDLDVSHVPGLRGATIEAGDPIRGEWDVVVLGPHFSAALLARDLGDSGPEMERRFEYALTYDRGTVTEAAHGLLSRVAAQDPTPTSDPDPAPGRAPIVTVDAAPAAWLGDDAADVVIQRAVAESMSGLTIADMARPDYPLVFVNPAFERLAGYRGDELLGRNCRFLQGTDTDRTALSRIRAAVAAGRECREVLLNFRGPERSPWWNEIHLSPVRDSAGRVVHYMGVQSDVTARVDAERALVTETERSRSYLARIEQLANTDSLTGLLNRRRFEEQVESALTDAEHRGRAVALLFLDLDGFKAVNDAFGHVAGDRVLRQVAERLRAVVGAGLLARLGGDEFVIALTGLEPEGVDAAVADLRRMVDAALVAPLRVEGHVVALDASLGVAMSPVDAREFGALLHLADLRMYDLKHPGRGHRHVLGAACAR